jgi:hypothetical protein
MVIAFMAVAATVSLPLGATAQTPTSQSGTSTPPVTAPPLTTTIPPVTATTPPLTTTTPPVTPAAPPKKPLVTPAQHLDDAKRVLDAMPAGPSHGDLHDTLAALRKNFTEMASTYASGAAAPHGPKDLDQPTPVEWQNKFFGVETDLVMLIGGGSSSSPDWSPGIGTSGSASNSGAAPVGTTGTTAGTTPETAQLVADQGLKPLPEGMKGMDLSLRTQLEQFRTQLELFYDSTTTHDYEAHAAQ